MTPQLVRDTALPDETNFASVTSIKMRCIVWASFLIGAKPSDAIPLETLLLVLYYRYLY
jgi:hypothetical protein